MVQQIPWVDLDVTCPKCEKAGVAKMHDDILGRRYRFECLHCPCKLQARSEPDMMALIGKDRI